VKRSTWAALLLTACGSTPPPAPPPPDLTLSAAARAGRVALELQRPDVAARQYAAALRQARQRDDAAAIGDTGIGLAAAELAAGAPARALQTARAVGDELARRGAPAPAALILTEALALHRLGDLASAEAAAAGVTQRAGEDADAGRRAWFLRGLIAAARRDPTALAAARAALGEPEVRAFRADARELAALAALDEGDTTSARRLAAEAAALRRDGLDYRGLGRALALEAGAAGRAGDAGSAADLYLRAGRGAAARGEPTEARRWLGRAQTLARQTGQPAIGSAARIAMQELATQEADAAGRASVGGPDR